MTATTLDLDAFDPETVAASTTDPRTLADLRAGDIVHVSGGCGPVPFDVVSEAVTVTRDEHGVYVGVIELPVRDIEGDDEPLAWLVQAASHMHTIERVEGPVPGVDPAGYAHLVAEFHVRLAGRAAATMDVLHREALSMNAERDLALTTVLGAELRAGDRIVYAGRRVTVIGRPRYTDIDWTWQALVRYEGLGTDGFIAYSSGARFDRLASPQPIEPHPAGGSPRA